MKWALSSPLRWLLVFIPILFVLMAADLWIAWSDHQENDRDLQKHLSKFQRNRLVFEDDGDRTVVLSRSSNGIEWTVAHIYRWRPDFGLVMLFNSPFALGLTVIILFKDVVAFVVQRRRRLPGPACEKCGYCLTGLTSSVCPECGTAATDLKS
ncbi:MAG: hypothetical protein IPK83_17370 [Planctomycetes bacterium]|nr:hypothetical protein [Planctomycetota bacterium]